MVIESANILLWSVEVGPGPDALDCPFLMAAYIQPVVNDDVRLKFPDKRISYILIPRGRASICIKPKNVDLTVVGEQFSQLGLHAFNEFGIFVISAIGIAPVHWRKIPTEHHARIMRRFCQLGAHVASERRIHYIVVIHGIQQAITEAKGFDLLTMGRPEGPGCYCAANNMLRQFMDKLSSQYKYVIIDNEAGMEHLSRRTTNNVELLLILANPTSVGIVTAKRIAELADELSIAVKEKGVVWNRTDSPPERESELDEVKTFGCVPADESVLEASMTGKNVFDLDADSPAYLAVCKILDNKLKN